jgi:hypothetical protein
VKVNANLGSLFYAASMALLGAMGAALPTSFIPSTSAGKEAGHWHDKVDRAAPRVAIAAAVEDVDPFFDGGFADVDINNSGLRLYMGTAQPAIQRLSCYCIRTAIVDIAPKQSPPSPRITG